MSDIAPLNGPSVASLLTNTRPARPVSVPAEPGRGSDQIELSDTARILARVNDLPDVRENLVNRVRAEIADGTYETPERLDAAIEGLAQDLAQS